MLESVFTEPYRIRKLIVCSFHQAPAEISISTVTPISCWGLWKLVSKPLCPSSLWDRTAKVLRGGDLEDLSSAACFPFFYFQLFTFLLLWHSCQRKGPSRPTCLTPNSRVTPVFGTLQKPRASLEPWVRFNPEECECITVGGQPGIICHCFR